MRNFCKLMILAFMLSGSLSSCVGLMAKGQLTEKKGCIPPEFGKEETVLMAVTYKNNSYDRYLRKHVTEQYGGEVVFVDVEDLENPQYSDIDKYRYLFDFDRSTNTNYNAGTGRNDNFTSYVFFVYDRKEEKEYSARMTSSFYGKLIRSYMVNLEKKRLASL